MLSGTIIIEKIDDKIIFYKVIGFNYDTGKDDLEVITKISETDSVYLMFDVMTRIKNEGLKESVSYQFRIR